MSLIQWPFFRKHYDGLNNPRFDQDIVAANQAVLDALTSLAGLGPTDFAIFSGLVYTLAAPNNYYTPGIFYLNGTWYYLSSNINETQYLGVTTQDIMSEGFPDGNSRNIYTLQQGLASSSGGVGFSPQISGNMNAYRMDNKSLSTFLAVVQKATIALVSDGNTLTAAYIVSFTQDQIINFTTANVSSVITLSAAGAIPGTVVRLRWTWGAGLTLAITAGAGQTIYRDSGSLGLAASNTNTLYIIYCGKNDSGNDEFSYSFNQTAYP
jgi:hypothetical protein